MKRFESNYRKISSNVNGSIKAGSNWRRRAVLAAVSAAATVGLAQSVMASQTYYWDPLLTAGTSGGGAGTWNTTTANWYNGTSGDVSWDSTDATTAVFGGTSGGVVNLVSPTATPLKASGLTFNTTGYTLSSSAFVTGTTPNTLTLTGSNPVISIPTGDTENIGASVSGGAGPDKLVLAGSGGFTLSGGGTLALLNAITLTGGITVNNSTLAEGAPGIASGVTSYTFLNNNALTLNNSTFVVNSTNSPSSTIQAIQAISVSGNSLITLARGNTANSSSLNFTTSPMTVAAGTVLTFGPSGNTCTSSTTTPTDTMDTTTLQGSATFVAYDNATVNVLGGTASPASAVFGYGTNVLLGIFNDNGFQTTFLSGGSSTLAGTKIQVASTGAQSLMTGTWVIGNNNPANPEGVAVDAATSLGHVGVITSGNITVNPYSQLWLDGVGQMNWGSASNPTIQISGIGTVLPANMTTSSSGGALSLTNTTTVTTLPTPGNDLLTNVNMVASSSINIASNTLSEIDGSISGTGPMMIVGGGTLNLGGTTNSWNGGTTIYNGSLVVNSGSSLSSYTNTNGDMFPLTLASSGTTSSTITSTSLTLNVNQTVGTLSSSFAATSGTASNNIKLNGVNLNIVQGSNQTFGPGAVPTLTSTISDGTVALGSISLDAHSTGALTFTGANTYTGGTTINGGSLFANNPTGSATGTGKVTVNAAGTFGGNGTVTGAVTVNGGTLTPGATSGGAHLAGRVALGGLTFTSSSGTLDFSLNTPGSSDTIALSSGALSLGSAVDTVPINITNLGALEGATYHLITYSGSVPSSSAFSSLFINPATEPTGFGFTLENDAGSVDLLVAPPPALTWAIGNGTWDTISTNWSGFSTKYTDGNSVVFNDSNTGGSSIAVNVQPGGVSPAVVTFGNNSKNYTVSGGSIMGNATLLVTGTGSVTLQSANTFTGIVAVDGGGTLSINADNELGNSANAVSLTSASASALSTLQVTSTLPTSRGITLYSAGGAIDVTGSNVFTISGSLVGGGGLTKTDTGTLLLTSASNGYTGTTTVSSGTLQLGAAGAIPAYTDLTVATGATFDTQTFSNNIGSLAGAGTVKIGTGATLTSGFDNASTVFSGAITGAGAFGKTGSGQLTLSGTGNTFAGGFTISGGGKVIAGAGGLGSGLTTIGGASTLQLTPASFTFGGAGNPTLATATGGALVVAPSNASITLPTVGGANPLTISGGNVTVTSSSTTAGGSSNLTMGTTTDGGDTLVIGNTDTNGNIGITDVTSTGAGGAITMQSGGTYYQNESLTTVDSGKYGLQIGFKLPTTGNTDTLGIPAGISATFGGNGAATGNGTLTLNNNTTWKATGFNAYAAGSPTVATGASITISVPNSGDTLIDTTAWRAATTNDTLATINVTGNGLYEICSGAITTTMYAGSWNVNMGSTGKFVVGQITGDTGETLNALGYNGSSGLGWSGVTNPVTLNGGTMVFAEDSINPGDSTPPQNVNSFRSPLTILAPAAIATSGLEYSSTTTGTSGAILDTTPVSANIAGDIDNFSQLTVDTYDPINGGARNLNFTTNGLSVAGNFTWEDGSSMVVSSGGTTGGELNFGRTAAQGGSVSVNGAATITINSGSTVNVGKTYSAAGGLVTVAGAVDPFTDAGVTSDPTDSDTTFSVAATVAGTLDYAARTGSTGDTGFKPYHLASLAIQSGGLVSMDTAAVHTNRSVLITSSVSIAGTGSLDLGGNDLMIPGGGGSALTSVNSLIKKGFNAGAGYWNGTGGIVSSAAKNDTRFLTTLGSAIAGPAGIASFDGVTTGAADVLMKYTYYGDATLDGTVNGADYQQIDNGFGLHLTGWSNGDFNYDGVVDGSDYSLIDNTFNQITATGASPLALDGGSALIASGSNLSASPADLTPAAVPEPGSLTLLTIGAASLLGRRRRRA